MIGITYAYKKSPTTTDDISGEIMNMADLARKSGLLSLEEYVGDSTDKLTIEGVLSIQAGENVRVIKEKMQAILENNMDPENELAKAG